MEDVEEEGQRARREKVAEVVVCIEDRRGKPMAKVAGEQG